MQQLATRLQILSLDQQWIDAKFSPAQNFVYGEARYPISKTVAYPVHYPDRITFSAPGALIAKIEQLW